MNEETAGISRHKILHATAATTLAAPALILGRKAYSQQRKLAFAWNQNSFCLAPVMVAQERSFFEEGGLHVDLINYSGSTDQLLESIATDKADAAVDIIHRWLKPLGAGSDVKIIGSSHDGCMRLVGFRAAGATSLAALRGKTVGVSDLAAPDEHFFTTPLARSGISPDEDITWRQYPADLLGVAVDKGEVQAIADGDPSLYLLEKRTNGVYVELATNLSGEYARKVCCVVDARGELVRDDRSTTSALAHSTVQATDFVNENPNEAAKMFTKYSPKVALDDLHKLYTTLTYAHHPTGIDLRDEIAFYAEDFRRVGVIKEITDPQRLAQHVYMNMLARHTAHEQMST